MEGRPLECAVCKALVGFSCQMRPRKNEWFECKKCYMNRTITLQERQVVIMNVDQVEAHLARCQERFVSK